MPQHLIQASGYGPQYQNDLSKIPASSESNPSTANYQAPASGYGSQFQNNLSNPVTPAPAPVNNNNNNNNQYGGADLSNKSKQDDYARTFGFPGWEEYQNSLITPNNQEVAQVDSAFDSAMSYLNQAEEALRGFQPGIQQGIDSTVDLNTQLANTQKAQGERQIESAGTDTQVRLTNAISAARQALQESNMGGRQRFGRDSNVASALGEYGTSKFQQASGQARDTAETTYRSIAEQTQQLGESYGNAIAQLNQWKQTQMQSAQQEFAMKLQEINNNRSEAAQNKSFQKIQLLQDMRNRADVIKNQAMTFQQNLELQRQSYSQQIGGSINQFGANASAGVNQIQQMPDVSVASATTQQPAITANTAIGQVQQTGAKKWDPITQTWK